MRYLSFIAISLFSATILAGEVITPNEFIAGEKALAEEVNENFTSLADGINDNDARIDANIVDIEANSTALATKQNRVGACDPGSSIRVINEDGSVECELDDIGSAGVGDITAVTAGAGLNGGADSGDAILSVDTSVIQPKLSNSVCPAGQYVASIADNGVVTCSTPSTSSGDITAVNTLAGSGLTGGAASGDVTLAVDTNVVQQKLSGSVCGGDNYVKSIAPDGSTTCSTPPTSSGDITAVNTLAGSGLTGGAASGDVTLAVDTNVVQEKLSGSACVGNNYVKSIAPNGTTTCAIPPQGDISSVGPGTGLSGGGTSGDVTLGVDFTKVQAVIQGTCSAGQSVVYAVATDGNVFCQPISNNGYSAGCGTSCGSTTAGDTSAVNINSVTVFANGVAGRILVHFNGTVECNPSAAGESIYLIGQITTSSTSTPSATGDGAIGIRETTANAAFYTYPIHLVRSFGVSSTGNKTYYANFRNFTVSAIGCNFYGGNMEAAYIP